MQKEEYLKTIDKVISEGKYKPNWESLSEYGIPEWYKKSKLGIFIHWGVYSVPAYYNEWYPRLMYYPNTAVHRRHIKKYGKDFDYSRFIDMFKANNFDAEYWVKSFKDMGADFLLPVAEHHDGFKMYKSELSPFNAAERGPKRDVIGELKSECEKQNMIFAASSHYAERYFYYNGARLFKNNEIVKGDKSELYGPAYKPDNINDPIKLNAYSFSDDIDPSDAWLESWLINTAELIDNYKPRALWFDWWVSNKRFKPYMMKMAAYYYNRSIEWGYPVCIQSKFDSMPFNQGIFDCERGQLGEISHYIWQSETATSYSSWGYTENSKYKSPQQIVCNYIDVLSKNGKFILNFGPKADGTFAAEELEIIDKMGKWLRVHNEILHSATPFRVYGEGKKRKHGSFKERIKYSSSDIRFLYAPGKLYVFALKHSKDNSYFIRSLADKQGVSRFVYGKARVIGSDAALQLHSDSSGLRITLDKRVENDDMPICFELSIS